MARSRSYEQVNYTLRPAKHIERKMIAEALRRLFPFQPVDTYRYVGFGSIYFADFLLFHRELGVTDMLSIEHDVANQARFTFNQPFNCVTLEFAQSTDVLVGETWKNRTILWLDYDGGLDRVLLTDVREFCANARDGSVILVSVNAQADLHEGSGIERLTLAVGAENTPPGLEEKEFPGWGYSHVARRVIVNHIEQILAARRGTTAPEEQIVFKPLFFFQYADGVRMLTVGGLVHKRHQEATVVRQCEFESLPFVRTGDAAGEPFRIEPPRLTYRELRFLDQQLPVVDVSNLSAQGIPIADLRRYAELYRYFPTFTVADL